MDAAGALEDLTELSTQIEAAVIWRGDGEVEASTLSAGGAARLAGIAHELLTAAARIQAAQGRALAQLEAATGSGSVFVVREEARTIAATTRPEPTSGLVLYDLRACLRSIAEEPGDEAA